MGRHHSLTNAPWENLEASTVISYIFHQTLRRSSPKTVDEDRLRSYLVKWTPVICPG